MSDRFDAAMARGRLLLDAAMGTRLIAKGLKLAGDDPALWNVDHPKAVLDLHRCDVAAGSEALLANTFGANRAWLARFDRAGEVRALNRAAVALARKAGGCLVFGSIGPTAAVDPGSYLEQATILVEAGVDAILFETHRLEQADLALRTVGRSLDVPRLVSLVDWPEDFHAVARRIEALGASALGANCQNGMEPALRLAERLRRATSLPLIVKPSAGLPGGPLATPEAFAVAGTQLLALGPILAGGCCGTTEAHVAALGKAWYHAKPLPSDASCQGPGKVERL